MAVGDVFSEIGFSLFLDFICFIVVLGLAVGIELFVEPRLTGFFCADLSLRYTFKGDTLPRYVFYALALLIPLVVITVTESSLYHRVLKENRKSTEWLSAIYKTAGVYLFGYSCILLVVNLTKVFISRLSPCFFTACDPRVDCRDYEKQLVHSYQCDNLTDDYALKQARLSFPSGISALTAFAMFYLVVYTEVKLTWKGAHFLKRFLQVCLILVALCVGYSRITDHARHWSDVAVGLGLGTLSAYLTAVYLSNLYKPTMTEYGSREFSVEPSMYTKKSRTISAMP